MGVGVWLFESNTTTHSTNNADCTPIFHECRPTMKDASREVIPIEE